MIFSLNLSLKKFGCGIKEWKDDWWSLSVVRLSQSYNDTRSNNCSLTLVIFSLGFAPTTKRDLGAHFRPNGFLTYLLSSGYHQSVGFLWKKLPRKWSQYIYSSKPLHRQHFSRWVGILHVHVDKIIDYIERQRDRDRDRELVIGPVCVGLLPR